MAYFATGTGGADTLDQSGNTGPGTIVGLGGDDSILTGTGLVNVSGDSGNDEIVLRTGNTGTVNGGSENDSIVDNFSGIGSMQLFGGSGDDLIDVFAATSALTIVGGDDSNDGADELRSGQGADLVFGNGGDDLAALIAACDVVVTISNVTAHLAGALGTRTFAFVPFERNRPWYWFKDRADSPWYPRLRVTHQARGQAWGDVVAASCDDVASAVGA